MPSDYDSGDDGRRRPPGRPQDSDRGEDDEREIEPGLRPPKRPAGQRFGAPPGDDDPGYPEEPPFAAGRGSGGRPPAPPESGRSADPWFDDPPPRRDQLSSADLYAAEDDYDDFLAPPPPAGPPPRQRSRILPVFIALLALAGFAALLWYAYSWGVGGTDSANIPLVTAEQTPAKIAPEEPGGMEIPNQDKQVLNPEEGANPSTVERLLPPPEEPSPPQVSAEPAPQLPEKQEAVDAQGTGSAVTAPEQGSTAPQAPQSAPQPPAAPAPEQAPEQAPAQPAEQPVQQPAAAPEQQAQAEPPPPQLTEPPAGSFVMQLASVRSPDTARSEWARMQAEHDLLLGDMPLFIQQVELEGRGTYFRIQTGPFPSRSTAQDLCAQLKTAGQDCLVTQR